MAKRYGVGTEDTTEEITIFCINGWSMIIMRIEPSNSVEGWDTRLNRRVIVREPVV